MIAEKQLPELQALGPEWLDEGISPPNAIALELARSALQLLEAINFQPSSINPSTDEGICISFSGNQFSANIEFFNTGEVFAAYSLPGAYPHVWEVAPGEVAAAIERIRCLAHG